MEPITRKEMYLAKMSGDYSGTVPEPVTRMDYYMAYAAGAYSGPLPKPIRQQEFYWAYICGATDIELPEPVTRVDMYLAAICGGMILLPEPITREEIYLAKIAKQSQYVLKSVAGKEIVLTDSLDAPFEDFHVYGHTTQDTTTGAQLFDADKLVSTTIGNVEIKNNGNGSFSVIGDGEISQIINYYYNYDTETSRKILKEGTITLQNTAVLNPHIDVLFYCNGVFKEMVEISATKSYNLTQEDIGADDFYIRIRFYGNSGSQIIPGTTKPMLYQDGDGTWEPYTGGQPSPNPEYPQELVSAGDKESIEISVTDGADSTQTLTLSTPNGLPGIPVTSGGNYTDENGQQWICDEVDFGRGVYVKRVDRIAFNGNESWYQSGEVIALVNWANKMDILGTSDLLKGYMSNIAIETNKYNGAASDIPSFTTYNSGEINWIVFNMAYTVKEWKDKLSRMYAEGNPVTVQYILANPVETSIPTDELAAYHELHTNYPTTTITNDEDCWMAADYRSKPVSQYSEAAVMAYLAGE